MVDGNQAAGKVFTSDANGTATWQTPTAAGTTLDGAYDFGGAGAGRTITADTGAVTIAGTDGLVSTGTELVGAIPPSGAGTRMVWNPRKSAFRAGTVIGTKWDNASIGTYSTAFGYDTTASGANSTSGGANSTASGGASTALGSNVTASGLVSTAFGADAVASGSFSTAFGFLTTAVGRSSTAYGRSTFAFGNSSTAFGHRNNAFSFGEVVVGIGATSYTPGANGDTEFGSANATDRLFTIGNAIDINNNADVDNSERSDALIILKNGLTRLPSTTNAMITAADGKAVVTKEYLTANSSGTLDQAYDFGGAGAGRTITADAGAVTIDGTDGLVSTGTVGSGAVAPSGAGTRMVWNPNKAAFRAGSVTGTQWNDIDVGLQSTAFGFNTVAKGDFSTAFGFSCVAVAPTSIAIGSNTTAQGSSSIAMGDGTFTFGSSSTAMGLNTFASGSSSTAMGNGTNALGNSSTSIGMSNFSRSFGETVIGIGATDYTTSVAGASRFRAANATDRLLVVGNTIDANNNDIVDVAERSDALVILKNGLTRLPSTTNAMITASDGKAVVTKEYLAANTSGTLDQAYDFGGAGAGRTITADTGAVTIAGTDGLVSTGTVGSGAVAPSGAGTRMVWNPNKAAFRAGGVNGTQWDDVNIGSNSFAFGFNSIASASLSTAFGSNTTASGIISTTFGSGTTASGDRSTAFGVTTTAVGNDSTAFGSGTTASGPLSTAFGSSTTASGSASTAFGSVTTASGTLSTAFGASTTASGSTSTTFGRQNTASSFGETVLGIGATTYTPSVNGATQFRAANATDRLLVVGNAIDANNNATVDLAERSDALVILKDGLTRLPSTTNAMITASDGKAVVTKEYLAANTSGTLDQAYDFGGAGAGRTITADAGAVTIAGTDGLVVSGNSGFGVAAPVARAQLQTASSATKTLFTQALANSGLLITTDFVANNFTPGLFWNTSNNNITKPKAGLFLRETTLGTFMHFGTSNSYATGITNDAVEIDPDGNVGVGVVTPLTTMDVLGALTLRDDGSNIVLTIDNQLISVNGRGHIRLSSNDLVATNRTIGLSDGAVIGQLLIIENADSGLDSFEVLDDAVNRNTNTSGSRAMGPGDIIMLMWTGNLERGELCKQLRNQQ